MLKNTIEIFSESSLRDWLEHSPSQTCPTCGAAVDVDSLKPNFVVRSACEALQERRRKKAQADGAHSGNGLNRENNGKEEEGGGGDDDDDDEDSESVIDGDNGDNDSNVAKSDDGGVGRNASVRDVAGQRQPDERVVQLEQRLEFREGTFDDAPQVAECLSKAFSASEDEWITYIWFVCLVVCLVVCKKHN